MRIEVLTFLRFIAAAGVIVYHWGKKTDLYSVWTPMFGAGAPMVTFFFTLSGFVMLVSHYNRKQTLREYYVSRIARITPVYYLALTITALYVFGWGKNNLKSLLLSTFFLQGWFPPYPLTMNMPGWSLSTEAFFYILFPAILLLVRNSNLRPLSLFLVAVGIYMLTQFVISDLYFQFGRVSMPPLMDLRDGLLKFFPISHLCSFMLGIAGGYLYLHKQACFHRKGLIQLLLIILISLIAVNVMLYPNAILRSFGFRIYPSNSYLSIFFILVILIFAYGDNVITRTFSHPVFVTMGEASYGIYILQQPVRIMYDKYILSRWKFGDETEFYLYSAILLVVSVVTYLYFEKPCKKLIINTDRYFKKRKEERMAVRGKCA